MSAPTLEWMNWLEARKGMAEVPGPTDNSNIIDMFKHTTYKASHDEVPWCAACACSALEETGYASPHSATAATFINYGTPCELIPGCIVVFKWASGEHHVTFCHHVVDKNYVACLGGNQSNQIKISLYERKYIVATRWPNKTAI